MNMQFILDLKTLYFYILKVFKLFLKILFKFYILIFSCEDHSNSLEGWMSIQTFQESIILAKM